MDTKEMQGRLNRLYQEALAILDNPEAKEDELGQADTMLKEAVALRDTLAKSTEREELLKSVEAYLKTSDGRKSKADTKDTKIVTPNDFDGFETTGMWLKAIRYNPGDTRLKHETKDLAEAGGASGGFLAPGATQNTLLEVMGEGQVFEPRCARIPMTTRSVRIPVLDQSGAQTGSDEYSSFFGGVYVEWTEEAAEKPKVEPSFKEIELVVHKLTAYMRASDELLADTAVGMEAILTRLMGNAMGWARDYNILRGNGTAKPLGVLNAPALISLGRKASGNSIELEDIVKMMSRMLPGARPVWYMGPSAIPDLYALADAGSNSVWIANAREGAATTLFGLPVIFTEKMPEHDAAGGVLLADMGYYLVGDRQALTIAASEHERFRYDQTAWRCVSRMDGQPWLKSAIALNDGTTTVSPFVTLDAA